LLCTQTRAVIQQVQNFFPPMDEDQRQLLRQYLGMLYRATGCPEEGRLPFETFFSGKDRFSGLFVPTLSESMFDQDPWDIIKSRWDSRSSVFLDIPRMLPYKDNRLDVLLKQRYPVETTICRRLSYMVKMGFATATQLREVRYLEFPEYKSFYEAMFSGDLNQVYEVALSSTCPTWIDDLLYVV
jgi:hypothetical protein